MNLTPLKYLLFLENVTVVFRNYLCLKRRTRIIVLFWVFIETLNISFATVANSGPFRNGNRYFFLSAGISVYFLIASLYNCKRFYMLLLNFDAFYKSFDDGVYYKKMLRAQKVFTLRVVLVCGFITVVFGYFRVPNKSGIKEWVVSIILLYCYCMSNVRYVLQYFVMHCILFVISEQLRVITRSIDSELSAINERREDVEHADLSSLYVNQDKLNKWVKAYKNINKSVNLYNSVFSIQLTIMLLIVTAYYIILMYTIALLTVEGFATLTALLPKLLSLMVFLGALLVISYAGQRIQNNYVELRRKLCELCVHSLEMAYHELLKRESLVCGKEMALDDLCSSVFFPQPKLDCVENSWYCLNSGCFYEKFYKLTKDLLRCVRTRPVRVHVFGTLDVNMSMLPSVIAFFTTYTVIALQFNNVL